MSDKPLYIPTNTPDNNDIITGFGVKELSITGVGLAVAVIIAIMLYGFTQNIMTAILLPAGGVVVLVVCIWRDVYDESLIDKLMYVWRYYQAQKCYKYEYYDYIEEMIKGLEKDGQ